MPTRNELILREIFFNALAPHVYGLAKHNIKIEQVTEIADRYRISSALERMAIVGNFIDPTSVVQVKIIDMEVPLERMKDLRDNITSLTNIHTSYNQSYIGIHAHSEAFIEILKDPEVQKELALTL